MDTADHDSSHGRITRRALLRGMAAAGLAPPALLAGAAPAAPDLDAGAWRLRVHGRVRAPLELSLADLRQLGGETVAAFLECAGSGWVGNAAWTGVPLRRVLALAGVREDAAAVIARGGDSAGYARSMPLAAARSDRPMLVWGMNGAALGPERGGPARLLVPGWAGEASVKWLVDLEIAERMPRDPGPANPSDRRLRPLREMPPRAVIAAPATGEVVRAGRRVVRGYAWSGYAPVASVTVTVDGGATWREAEIVERAGAHAWVRFAVAWDARPGPATLAARATDALGLTQPLRVPEHARGLIHNAVVTLPVTVRG